MKNFSTFLNIALTVILLGFLANFSASAQNKKISIQGFLKDGNGKAVDNGNYSITFKIYDVATGGTALWTEDNNSVNVYGGIYTVLLGGTNSLTTLAWDKPYFLGVNISGTELTPRIELTYAPYALSVASTANAQLAEEAKTVRCSGAVGDVKYSILNPTQFAQVNGDCWIPMDGRSISGSKLSQIVSSNNVPDIGGLFVRSQEYGQNYDADRTNSSSIATFQDQSYQSHTHSGYVGSVTSNPTMSTQNTLQDLSLGNWGNPHNAYIEEGANDPNYIKVVGQLSVTLADHGHSLTINNNGSAETRPKNVNLWTYIRIN
jgi:hypothetical protein